MGATTIRRVAAVSAVLLLWAGVGPGAGAKTVNGGDSDDVLIGTSKKDTLNGGGNDDVMFGKGRRDTLNTSSGADRSFGGPGADSFVVVGCFAWSVDDGGSGDTINDGGCLNNFIFSADGGVDTITCGSGPVAIVDVADNLTGSCTEVTANGPAGSLQVQLGTSGRDNLSGTTSNDEALFGRGRGDRLNGGEGRDMLFGGTGDDRLIGGLGEDTLIDDGGSGDILLGGADGDELYSADGGEDKVKCGDGPGDKAFVDRFDVVRGCEEVVKRTTLGT